MSAGPHGSAGRDSVTMLTLARVLRGARAIVWPGASPRMHYLGIPVDETEALVHVSSLVLAKEYPPNGRLAPASASRELADIEGRLSRDGRLALDSLLRLADMYVERAGSHADTYAWYRFATDLSSGKETLIAELPSVARQSVRRAVEAFTLRMPWELESTANLTDETGPGLFLGMVRLRLLMRLCRRLQTSLFEDELALLLRAMSEWDGVGHPLLR